MNWRTLAASCLVLFCAATASAQFDSAQVSGVVQDSSGGVLPGVDVVLVNVGTASERRAVTNEAGLYNFPAVPVGDYRITASLSGFKSLTKSDVRVNAGVNIRVDVALEVGALSEVVQVEAATTLVDTSVIGRTVRAEQIAETPLSGRRASQVAQLAPGVIGNNMGGAVPTADRHVRHRRHLDQRRPRRRVHDHHRRRTLDTRAGGRRLHDGRAELRHRGRGAGADHELPGRARPILGGPTAPGHQERHPALPRQHVLVAPERRARREHLDAQARRAGQSRRTSTTPTASRWAGRSTSRACSTRTSSRCSSSGARSGSATARWRNRPASCPRRRCATATSARCCPAA